MRKLDKKAIKSLAIIFLVLLVVLTLGFVFRSKSVPDYTYLPSTNWFLAIPFLLLLAALIVMGYLTDSKLNKGGAK